MKTKIIRIIFVIIGVSGLFAGYKLLKLNTPESNQFDKCITVIVTINDDISDDEYCTNSEFLGDLVDEYRMNFNPTFTGEKSDSFGRLLIEINGYRVESNEFFFIYVDDIYGNYGIDQQPLEDGVIYELRLGTY